MASLCRRARRTRRQRRRRHDLITALQAKLEGLEAYRKKLTQLETEGVAMLVDELEQLVKDGKLRLRVEGNGH